MQVIPLLGEDDTSFAPPVVDVGTRAYGSVELRNHADLPTLVPHGTGWVVPQKAQDHALAGGVLLAASGHEVVDTAVCIQPGQCGTIAVSRHEMVVLPAALRVKALAKRADTGFSRLWEDIAAFNSSFGIGGAGQVAQFLRHFARELGAFVAEFETIPGQVGAIVLVAGGLAGVERAPSSAYWQLIWEPLVRGCYGSVALRAATSGRVAPVRSPLLLEEQSLAGLRAALATAVTREEAIAAATVTELAASVVEQSEAHDAELGPLALTTVTGGGLAGQVATVRGEVRFASLCAAA
jgi:hypothetical protein